MPAHPDSGSLGSVDHHGRIPAQETPITSLKVDVTGVVRFLVHGDGIHKISGDESWNSHMALASAL
jgi:hypothetical protein